MALFEARFILRLSVLAALMGVRGLADIELKVSYGIQDVNSFAPTRSAWSLIANESINLDASQKLVIPCGIPNPSRSGVPILHLLTYFARSAGRPEFPDTSQPPVSCGGETAVAPVPQGTTFVVLYIDPASSARLDPPGVRAVFVQVVGAPLVTPVPASPAAPGPPVVGAKSLVATKSIDTAAPMLAGVALVISLIGGVYMFLSARSLHNEMQRRIPRDLEDRLHVLEAKSGDLVLKLQGLALRVDQSEAGRAAAPGVTQGQSNGPAENFEEAPRDPRIAKILAEIRNLRVALENWTRIAPDAFERDLKGETGDLCVLSDQVDVARNFDPQHLETLSRCSRSVALKVVFAADTSVDPKRTDVQVQRAVAQVAAAARLDLVDPPSNSDPRDYGATVLSATIQRGASGRHGGVAAVQRRGLRYGPEFVERPQVYVYD